MSNLAEIRLNGGHSPWLFYVAFYAIFANIPFWVASHWLGILPLGWLCTEYAVVGTFALFVPRIATALLFSLAIAADLTSAVSKTYYLTPTQCVVNAGSLAELPSVRLWCVAAVLILSLAAAITAASFPAAIVRGRRRRYAAGCLLAFAAIAASIDCATAIGEVGQFPNPFRMERPTDSDKDNHFATLWMCRYPLIRLVRDQVMFRGVRISGSSASADTLPAPSAASVALDSTNLFAKERQAEMPNIVLTIVESWGFDTDSSIRDALVGSYSKPALLARYRVSQGTVPFFGATVEGEARELCGNQIGARLLRASTEQLRNCLPERLGSLGYYGIAMHGMNGRMFDRHTWYSTIGFKEKWFREDFRRQGLPDCTGAFTGTCDASIAEWIGHRLETKDAGPDFAYWMTLNSHLPVAAQSSLQGWASCSFSPSLSERSSLCGWYQLVFNVHDSIARMAMRELARPTIFIVVGDHAPPFSNAALRDRFSSTSVPYVILMPRKDNLIAGQQGQ